MAQNTAELWIRLSARRGNSVSPIGTGEDVAQWGLLPNPTANRRRRHGHLHHFYRRVRYNPKCLDTP